MLTIKIDASLLKMIRWIKNLVHYDTKKWKRIMKMKKTRKLQIRQIIINYTLRFQVKKNLSFGNFNCRFYRNCLFCSKLDPESAPKKCN